MSDCRGGYESDSSEEDESRVKPLPPLQGRKKSLRFSEPPVTTTKRLSRFPSLQRRESIICSYRSGLYDPKVVTFVKNGDKFFEGVKINVSRKNFRSFDILLSELSRCIELPAGVRNVYTPEGGHRVTNLTQFEHKQTYVCASTEPFKKMDYGTLKNPNWQSAPKLKHQPPAESVFSKNFNLNASLNASVRSLNASVRSERTLFTKPRRQSVKPVRPRQMRLCSIVTEADEESPEKEKVGAIPALRVPNPSVTIEPKPVSITVIRNGPPPRQCVTILLNKNTIVSWEHVTRLISENLNTINGCLRLFKLDGEEVQSLSQLWKAGNMLIAVGNEAFGISEFMRGEVLAPVEQTSQQVNLGEGVDVKGSSEFAASEVDLHEQSTAPSQIGVQARPDSGLQKQSQDYSHSQDVDSEADYRDQAQHLQKILSKPHFPPTPLPTMPITSLEDPLQLLPPKNCHLFGQDRPNTGSSYSSISMLPGVSTPKVFPAQLICPQTPQSEVSLGVIQSVVDMILPRGMDRMNSDASTFSSETSSSTEQKTSRNIGIQTDFVNNHLSTVFETEEELTETQSSMNLRGEGVGMRRQNSTASQTDFSTELEASSYSRHSKKKEKYTVRMLIGEGNYAVVKEIREKETNRDLVLRVINKARVFGQEDLIINELKIMKKLRHENILQVVDDWETNDEICLVLEQIEGGDLFDTILHCQHFSELDAMKAMHQLGQALVDLHAHRIVHRDIKPENIFLTSSSNGNWKLKLGGFSLAVVVTEPLSLVCGTPYYMAPEMLMETGYGTKVDVWAAGIICYILLAGFMPFRRKNNMDMFVNIKSEKYSFPSPFWDHVSEEAKDFIRKLLVAAPRERYSSSEMLQHSWLNDHSHWEQSENSKQLSRRLMEHLNSKSATKNATFSVLTVTALDKRRSMYHDRKLQ